MDGKYVGNRPIKLRKSNWKERNLGKYSKLLNKSYLYLLQKWFEKKTKKRKNLVCSHKLLFCNFIMFYKILTINFIGFNN